MTINLSDILTLQRPLAVLDLETTGFDSTNDRIWQIHLAMHYPRDDKRGANGAVRWGTLVNPERACTPFMTERGITDADFVDKPIFAALAPALAPKILTVDIMGFNVDFDIDFLRAQMARCGVKWAWSGDIVDAKQIYHKKVTRTLSDAYVEFGGEHGAPLPKGTKLEGAHDAGVDVEATEIVLVGQLHRYPDLPRTVPELARWCNPQKENAIDSRGRFVWGQDGVPCIAFGKYAKNGPSPLVDVVKRDKGYLTYILNNFHDFPPDAKEIISQALAGVYPTRSLL